MNLERETGRRGACDEFVAQISNLLYRRIPFGRASKFHDRQILPRPADWKSAIQQNGILRYEIRGHPLVASAHAPR